MIQARRLGGLMLHIPTGALASPGPRGKASHTPSSRVRAAQRFATRALGAFWSAWRANLAAALVVPFCSKVRASSLWRYLCGLEGVTELSGRSLLCLAQKGCSNLCLLLTGLPAAKLAAAPSIPSAFGSPLARAESKLPAALEAALEEAFCCALQGRAVEPAPRVGLESLLVNDLLAARSWSVSASWVWRETAHINLLETRAYLKALRDLAKRGDDARFVHIVDSAVTLHSTVKGRSSARTLEKALKQGAALQLAGGLYPAPVFGPTRLNIADDPSRGACLREPCKHSVLAVLKPADLYTASTFRGLCRSSANWLRLSCLLIGFRSSTPLGFFLRALKEPPRTCRAPQVAANSSSFGQLAFDSTLGYPGEGPLGPRDAQDRSRQQRRSGNDLPQGRPVLARTRVNRARLLVDFEAWLAERGRSLENFLSENPPEVQALNTSLVAYGRELYDAGRPYWIYSETVNSVAARAPTVRRQLQQAWDLGFSWLAMEPYSHHVPLPGILLCAILTACLVWGWVREAGLFALAWGGLLRIGEATNAKRADLVLPRDVLFTQCFVLLRIQEPKTRLRMARHQAARVEPQDLVELIDLVFQGLRSDERLWPRSQQTLRKRLDAVLARLGITPHEGEKALDLGSFRPGGATYLLQQTEDSELTRRRGRWASHKVMEIYLQEVASITFYPRLPLPVREQVLRFAQGFRPMLEKAKQWDAQGIPPTAWYSLLLAEG